MTPPTAKAELLRLRVRLVRRQTLRKLERVTWVVAGGAAILYLCTRFLL